MQPVLISLGDSYLDKYIWCLMCSTHGKFYKWLHWLISLSISIASGWNWLKLTSSWSYFHQRWPVQQGLLVRYLKDWCESTCRSNTKPPFLMFFCLFVSLFVWLLLKFPKISVKYGQRWFHICNPLWCLQTAVIDAAVVLVVLLLLLLLLLL